MDLDIKEFTSVNNSVKKFGGEQLGGVSSVGLGSTDDKMFSRTVSSID